MTPDGLDRHPERSGMRAVRSVAAWIGLVVLLVGVPWVILKWGDWAEVTALARDPSLLLLADDGHVVWAVLTVLGAIFWLVLAASALLEIAAVARHRPQSATATARSSPLRLPRSLVRPLVSAAFALVLLGQGLQVAAAAPAPIPAAGQAWASEMPSQTLDQTYSFASAPSSETSTDWNEKADHGSVLLSHAPPAASGESELTDPGVYVVKPGDSLWSIAERFYGDGRQWVMLAQVNDDVVDGSGDLIRVGWKLTIPPPEADHSCGPSQTVEVEPGDTLWSIAENYLDDADEWPAIAQSNQDLILDPDVIQPGWQVVVPSAGLVGQDCEPPQQTADQADSSEESPDQPDQAVESPSANPGSPQTSSSADTTGEPTDTTGEPTDIAGGDTVTPTDSNVVPVTSTEDTDPTVDVTASPVTDVGESAVETANSPAGHASEDPLPGGEPSTSIPPEVVGEVSGHDEHSLGKLIGMSTALAGGMVLLIGRRRLNQLRMRPLGRRISQPSTEGRRLESALGLVNSRIDQSAADPDFPSDTSPADDFTEVPGRRFVHDPANGTALQPVIGLTALDDVELAFDLAKPMVDREGGVDPATSGQPESVGRRAVSDIDQPAGVWSVAAAVEPVGKRFISGLPESVKLPLTSGSTVRDEVGATGELLASVDTQAMADSSEARERSQGTDLRTSAAVPMVSDLSVSTESAPESETPSGLSPEQGASTVQWWIPSQTLSDAPEGTTKIGSAKPAGPAGRPLIAIGDTSGGQMLIVDISGAKPFLVHARQVEIASGVVRGIALKIALESSLNYQFHLIDSSHAFSTFDSIEHHGDYDDARFSLKAALDARRAFLGDEPWESVSADPFFAEAWQPMVYCFTEPMTQSQFIELADCLEGPDVGIGVIAALVLDDPSSFQSLVSGSLDVRSSTEAVLQPRGTVLRPLHLDRTEPLADLLQASGSDETIPAWWWSASPNLDSSPPSIPSASSVEKDTHMTPAFSHIIDVGLYTTFSHPTLKILGPIELEGARGLPPPRAERSCMEYCGWLLEHPGTTALAMAQGLLVAESTRRSNMSRLRSWLGCDPAGSAYLPEAYSGRIWLDSAVTSDWHRMKILLAAGVEDTETEQLLQALQFVRGAPLVDAAPGQWHWAEELRTDIVSVIRDIGVIATLRCLEAGDIDRARWAASHALSVAAEDEQLLCARVRTEHAAGNRLEVERLVAWITRNARNLGMDLLPETIVTLNQVIGTTARRN